jgi:hypothetical protein
MPRILQLRWMLSGESNAIKKKELMPDLRLFTSNRLEVLAEKLAELLRPPLPSPLESEIILVQSKGMERWVSMKLARYHGICANYRFPFPNRILLLPGQGEKLRFGEGKRSSTMRFHGGSREHRVSGKLSGGNEDPFPF